MARQLIGVRGRPPMTLGLGVVASLIVVVPIVAVASVWVMIVASHAR